MERIKKTKSSFGKVRTKFFHRFIRTQRNWVEKKKSKGSKKSDGRVRGGGGGGWGGKKKKDFLKSKWLFSCSLFYSLSPSLSLFFFFCKKKGFSRLPRSTVTRKTKAFSSLLCQKGRRRKKNRRVAKSQKIAGKQRLETGFNNGEQRIFRKTILMDYFPRGWGKPDIEWIIPATPAVSWNFDPFASRWNTKLAIFQGTRWRRRGRRRQWRPQIRQW